MSPESSIRTGLEKSAKLPVNVYLPAGVDATATVEPESVKVSVRRQEPTPEIGNQGVEQIQKYQD